ncbi:MAG: hypothetical protein IPJ51_11560 [Saprospiraceae bacterium]|nr:hypothetical protein [Saprospiraceae bacterium]
MWNDACCALLHRKYIKNNVEISKTDFLREKELKNGQMESGYHPDVEGLILQGEVRQCYK